MKISSGGPSDEAEKASLIREIIASHWFLGAGADLRIKVLECLFKHRNDETGITAKVIAFDVYPPRSRPAGQSVVDSGCPSTPTRKLRAKPTLLVQPSSQTDAAAARFNVAAEDAIRNHLGALRTALAQYNLERSAAHKWRCELPPGTSHGGLRLEFFNQEEHPNVVLGFWLAHLRPKRDVMIVWNAPLFYRVQRDGKTNVVVRFVDSDADEVDTGSAITALKAALPEFDGDMVSVSRLYLLRGEMDAREYIQDWFKNAASVLVTGGPSYSIQQFQIDSSSPVLLGNVRTNHLMQDLFENDGKEFQIRVCPKRFGVVTLRCSDSAKALALVNDLRRCRPTLVAQLEDSSITLPDQPPRGVTKDVFALVVRMPNPSGEGAITILCADYTLALGQIARTLTDDNRLVEILNQAEWPLGKTAPSSFEALFIVRLRGQDAANKPELLVWHAYPKSGKS